MLVLNEWKLYIEVDVLYVVLSYIILVFWGFVICICFPLKVGDSDA